MMSLQAAAAEKLTWSGVQMREVVLSTFSLQLRHVVSLQFTVDVPPQHLQVLIKNKRKDKRIYTHHSQLDITSSFCVIKVQL